MENKQRRAEDYRRKGEDRRGPDNVNYELLNYGKPDSRSETKRRIKKDRRKSK